MRTLLLSLFVLACFAGVGRTQDVPDRSKTVRTTLEHVLKKKAPDITAADLANLSELELEHIHIRSFTDNDFAGMTKLKKLYFESLFHKSGTKKGEIPAFTEKVFAKLPQLEELIIDSDELGDLPDDAFSGLKSLKVLELIDVNFERLPKSLLTLPKLEVIYCDGREMKKEHYEALKKAYGDKLKPRREPK